MTGLRDQVLKIIRGVQDADLAADIVISLVRASEIEGAAERRRAAVNASWETRRAWKARPTNEPKMDSDESISHQMTSSGSISSPSPPCIPLLWAEEEREEECSETVQEPSSPPPVSSVPPEESLLEFPCDGKAKAWHMTPSFLAKCQAAFPSLDVMAEGRKALLWLDSNPDRRKTARGMPTFLQRWLGRAQDRGGSKLPNARASPAKPPSTGGLCDFHRDWRNAEKRAPRHEELCSECKHAKALARRTEPSEPTTAADVLGVFPP